MKISTSKSLYLVIALLCFDSLLKVRLGPFYIQAGILLALTLFILRSAENGINIVRNSIRYDYPLLLASIYILLHFALALDFKVYLTILSYFIIFTFLYTYLSTLSKGIDWGRCSRFAIVILLLTGGFQYFLINVLGIQLELRSVSSEYYAGNGDLAFRMRGFFLEPNWFGLVLFSWTYLFIRSTEKFSKLDRLLILLVALAMYLSGNRLIYLLSLVIFLVSFIRDDMFLIKRWLPISSFIIAFFAFVYLSIEWDGTGDRSAIARLYTAANIFRIWLDSDIFIKIFGFGFSNWGYYSNLLEFSWSNYLFDQSLTRRDNSELYVVVFEMGLFGLAIIVLDLVCVGIKSKNILDSMFILSFYIAAFFYPIYSFLMYLFPLMVVRSRIFEK